MITRKSRLSFAASNPTGWDPALTQAFEDHVESLIESDSTRSKNKFLQMQHCTAENLAFSTTLSQPG